MYNLEHQLIINKFKYNNWNKIQERKLNNYINNYDMSEYYVKKKLEKVVAKIIQFCYKLLWLE